MIFSQCLYLNSSSSAILNISFISFLLKPIQVIIFSYIESLHAIFQFNALLTDGLDDFILSDISVIVIHLSSNIHLTIFQIKELLIKVGFILYIFMFLYLYVIKIYYYFYKCQCKLYKKVYKKLAMY